MLKDDSDSVHAVHATWVRRLTGHYSGENRGKALGWIERNDQEINRDAKRREQLNSRRDRDGTFQEAKR